MMLRQKILSEKKARLNMTHNQNVFRISLSISAILISSSMSCGSKEKDKDSNKTQSDPKADKEKPKADKEKPKEPKADKEKPKADKEKPKFDISTRFANVGASVGAGMQSAMTDIKSATAICSKQSQFTRPFCWQGVGVGYLADVDRDLANFEKLLTELGSQSPIHCVGLGYSSLQTISEEFSDLEKETAKLSEECQQYFWDGVGYSIAEIQLSELTKPCRSSDASPDCIEAAASAKAGASVDDGCKGAGNSDMCAFGFGRGNVYLARGNWEMATSWCTGKLRPACLAGVAFSVAHYLPEILNSVYLATDSLTGAEKSRTFEGIGIALFWRSESDKSDFNPKWLSGTDKIQSENLFKVAKSCGATILNNSKCEWPE